MIVKSLELDRFRNYMSLSMTFDSGVTILYGDNAQGKTNVLEAICLSATTKSHRGSKDKDMIFFEENESHIRLYLEKDGIEHKIDIHLKKNKSKGIAIDGIPIRKSADLFGYLNVVLFSPEDLHIIKNGPSERRRFINIELCQLDSIYLYHYANYQKILNQRNNLLKQINHNPSLEDTLEIWDNQLVVSGMELINRRKSFIKQLEMIMKEIHSNLTAGAEQVDLVYECNVEAEDFKQQLLHKREYDKRYQTTSVGPHRDDLLIYINGKDVKTFGSQGQQRTSALSMKLAEIELVKKRIGEYPVLLLDDVMSELDEKRRDYLLQSIKEIQTIITCTGYKEFIKQRLPVDCVYKVTNGSVSLEQAD